MAIESAAGFVRMTRAAIAAAGFVRRELGGTVYWQSTGEAGQSDTIVFIHGANDQAGTWFRVAPAIARTHRVLLPDLAGHGESPPSSGPIPLSLILERLEAVIDEAAGEAAVTLVGNSLGGWVSLLYTLRHPSRVKRLVLETSGGLSRPLPVPLVARTREEAIPLLRAVHGPAYDPAEWVIEALLQRSTDSPLLRLSELVEHEIESRLGEIRVPATLIWGAHDQVVPLTYAEDLRAAIPQARLEIISDAAHIPHMQQPERFLECLMAIC